MGIVIDDRVVEINRALGSNDEEAGSGVLDAVAGGRLTSMLDLLERWDALLPHCHRAAERLRATVEGTPLADIALRSPVPRPGKMVNVGLNFVDHAEEMGIALPESGFRPSFFFKGDHNCIIGPSERIELSSDRVDWEAELAVVMGRRARRVTAEAAMDHVAGYTCHNDVTDRALMLRPDGSLDFVAGKARDTFGPLGPTLVPREFVPDVRSLRIRLMVGDRTMQDFGCGGLVWGPAECIAYLSNVFTLEPGDVIALGTGAGVGWAKGLPPGPRTFPEVLAHFHAGGGTYLSHGDRVVVEIEGVGRLENEVA